MKISVITPSFNQCNYIEDTIRSVLDQGDDAVEHLVMDGGSTDGTVNILRKYPQVKWLSERDGGQADALNKGLARATGEVIGWINSDDYYAAAALPRVRRAFCDPSVQWMVGDVTTYFQATGRMTTVQSPKVTHAALLEDPDIVRQQPTFFRKAILLAAGAWDSRFHMAMDYDLWTRLARLTAPHMMKHNLAYSRIHGSQKTTRRNIRLQAMELAEIMRREGAMETAVSAMRRTKRNLIAKNVIKEWLVGMGVLNERYLTQPFRVPR